MKISQHCPFLGRVTRSYLQHAGRSLTVYSEQCPVMSRLMHTPARHGANLISSSRAPLEIERLYLSIHSSLPRASIGSAKQCPFHNVVRGVSTSATALTKETGQQQQAASDQEGIIPKGNCPFRWSDLITNTVKDKIKDVLPSSAATGAAAAAAVSSPNLLKDLNMPLIDGCDLDYEQFFADKIQAKLDDKSYRRFRVLTRNAGPYPTAKHYNSPSCSLDNGRDITVWCSNDYMGMSKHPQVIETTMEAIKKHGVGAGGTRNISGTSYYHCLLEKEVASLHQKEAGLIFSSCYVANDATLTTLGKMLPNCVYFSDSGNHASMIEGMRHSGAKKEIFRHNDIAHLEQLLKKYDPLQPKIVAFESVYSMTGKIGHIKEICEVAKRYNALTFIDEVHAVGLYGEQGAGVAERDGLLDQCDIISGTLGKAFGVAGGYIAGSAKMVDMVRSYASGFIFTTAMPPMQAVAATKSIQILRGYEGRALRSKHQASVKQLRAALVAAGLPVEHSPSHIVPVHVGNAELCTKASMLLMERHGIYVQDINYPTVPRGEEKLRIAPTPHHNDFMKVKFVDALVDVWNELELPFMEHEIPQPACSRLQWGETNHAAMPRVAVF